MSRPNSSHFGRSRSALALVALAALCGPLACGDGDKDETASKQAAPDRTETTAQTTTEKSSGDSKKAGERGRHKATRSSTGTKSGGGASSGRRKRRTRLRCRRLVEHKHGKGPSTYTRTGCHRVRGKKEGLSPAPSHAKPKPGE